MKVFPPSEECQWSIQHFNNQLTHTTLKKM